MFVCILWAGINARLLGHSAADIRRLMGEAVAQALPAVYIFILIGMVIAGFMRSGTIATLMHHGLGWLSPELFLPLGMALCALMSAATGTAWGTAGTLGVVLIGIGDAMGAPPAAAAAMVVCGATFGDKMSPVSDTTNLAAMSAGTDLYRHIRAMLWTTAPTFAVALAVFAAIGADLGDGAAHGERVAPLREALAAQYRLNPAVTLLPLAALAVLSARRTTPEAAMSAGVAAAAAVAVLYQGAEPAAVLNALWANEPGETGIESLDALLGRGGVATMSWTLLLALMALALGGILHGAGFLTVLLAGAVARARRAASLVAAAVCAGAAGNMAMGEAYISIILGCRLFREKFDRRGLDRSVLSRSIEEGATLTTGLIPWTTAGAFYAATLGVATVEYAPWAVFNYLNGFVSVAMAALGIGLMGRKGPK